jgi:hypothetical protein
MIHFMIKWGFLITFEKLSLFMEEFLTMNEAPTS